MDTLIGKKIGPYDIRDLIGRGGMAAVYRGYQATLNRYVAIKFLADWMSHDTEFVQRFRHEALAAGGLRHPNILTIHDAGVFEGRPYIVMDYVPTGTLADLMRQGPLSPERAVALTAQIGDALEYIHRRGIVHRDLKPTNVLMDEDGRPLLADFGIAQAMSSGPRLTQTGAAMGTPEYMSPEQGQGARVDGRSDVYSLGVILYQMLVGRVPFSAPTPMATLYQVIHNPPSPLRQINPAISAWLESITLKSLAKRPEDRFQGAAAMSEALRTQRVTSPSKKTPSPPVQPQRRTHPLAIVLGSLIGLVLIIVAAMGLSGLARSSPAATLIPTPTSPPVPAVMATSIPVDVPTAPPNPPTATPIVIVTVVSPAPTLPGEVLVVTKAEAEIRAGPNLAHPVLITVPAGQEVPVSGRTQQNDWWRITIAGVTAWIANHVVNAPPEALALPIIADIPTPPATATKPTSPTPTATPSQTATIVSRSMAVTARTNANLRSGPGTGYTVVGRVTQGQELEVIGRTPTSDWWQIKTASGVAWIAGSVVTAISNVSSAPTIIVPTPTSPPVSQSTPGGVTPSPAGIVFDFETFGNWRRGDQPYGSFAASSEQKRSGATAGKLTYDIPNTNENFVVFVRSATIPLPGAARALTLWVYGDNSRAFLNAWVRDSAGEVRSFTFGQVTHSGWQQMTAALDTSLPWPQSHISGPDNGQLDFPISLLAIVLDAKPVGAARGVIYLDDLGVGDAVIAGPSAGGAVSSTPTVEPSSPPSQSPAVLGGHILFTSGGAVHAVNAATKNTWPLAINARQPDIRGDGRVVYDGVGGGKDNLSIINLDGSQQKMVGAHPEDSYPHWSRTGDSAVFHSSLQGDGRDRIYIQRDMTYVQEPVKLTVGNTDVYGAYPTWLKSWRIAFTGCDYWASGSGCGIWVINSDGSGTGVQLTVDAQDRSTDEMGGILLYSSKTSGNWEVYAIAESGGVARNLTNSPSQDAGATFSPDGRLIAFMTDRGGGWGIWLMNADGSNPQKLIDVPAGFGNWETERLAWGP